MTQDDGVIKRSDLNMDIKYTTASLYNYKLIEPHNFVISLRSFQGGFELSDITGVVSPAYTIFSFKENNNQDELFWKYKFKTHNFIQSLKTITFGIRDGKSISFSEFKSLPLVFPNNKKEQKEIGEMFKFLEKMIMLEREKLNLYESLKKYLLQNLFPSDGESIPNVRFADFDGDWEQHNLGEISTVTKLAGFEFTKYVTYSDTGNIIALRGLNVKDGKLILNDIKFIDKSDFSKLQRSKLFSGDILFTYVGTVGQVAVVPENNKFYLAPNVSRIRLNSNFIPFFVSQILTRKDFYNHIITPLIATSSQPALSMENIRKINVNVTEKNEQNKISDFLRILDGLINMQKNRLTLYEKVKKYYLQKLFI